MLGLVQALSYRLRNDLFFVSTWNENTDQRLMRIKFLGLVRPILNNNMCRGEKTPHQKVKRRKDGDQKTDD